MKEVNFSFTKEEAELVLNGIAQLPYFKSAPLIQKMQEQAGAFFEELKEENTPEK